MIDASKKAAQRKRRKAGFEEVRALVYMPDFISWLVWDGWLSGGGRWGAGRNQDCSSGFSSRAVSAYWGGESMTPAAIRSRIFRRRVYGPARRGAQGSRWAARA